MTLEQVLETAPATLAAIPEEAAAHRAAPGRWSRKEILGHLIDSALNNHQRFVRAQLESGLRLASYEQERWVAAQGYQNTPWPELIALWTQVNRHLVRVIALVPPAALGHHLAIGAGAPVTLEWLIEDYVRHLEHHLTQILQA